MTLLRLLILAVAMALGTVLVSWWTLPVLAACYGLAVRSTRFPGLVAAAAGVLAWGGYLSMLSFGGVPVGRFAAQVAAAMNLPAWGPHVATLGFAAVLSGPAAYLTARLWPRSAPKPGRRGYISRA
jgi:hypothetical protein